MKHLMIDIETLGTSNNAAIISIGAVFFDPITAVLGRIFYITIKSGGKGVNGQIELETIRWWMKQPERARKFAFDHENQETIDDALQYFLDFIMLHKDEGELIAWAKSPNFDCTILRNAFDRNHIKTPWKFYNERDVRTCLDMGKSLLNIDAKELKQGGTAHIALDDAIYQAGQVICVYQKQLT